MASRNTDMQAIFSKLSERNQDILILIAKSVKVAQEVAEQPSPQCKQCNSKNGTTLIGRDSL